jgi:hypothetical protein
MRVAAAHEEQPNGRIFKSALHEQMNSKMHAAIDAATDRDMAQRGSMPTQ